MILLLLAQLIHFPLGQPVTLVWTPDAREATAKIDRYEVRLNAGPWVATGQRVPQDEYTWVLPPAWRTTGAHTLYIRACAGSRCTPDADVRSLAFTIAPDRLRLGGDTGQ